MTGPTISDFTQEEIARADALFEKNVMRDPNSGCWLWAGTTSHNYGCLLVGSRRTGTGRLFLAHRYSYERAREPIPGDMTLDHRVCRTPLCVNPRHLVVCSRTENSEQPDGAITLMRSRTHCPHGHPYGGDNLIASRTRMHRRCRECKNAQKRSTAKGIGKGGKNRLKTHCPRGHFYSEGNTYLPPSGGRHCRKCLGMKPIKDNA